MEWTGQAAPAKPTTLSHPSRWAGGDTYVGTCSQTESVAGSGPVDLCFTPDPLLEMSRQMGDGVNGREWSELLRSAGLDTV